jgi:hypothetical protein
MAAVGPSGVSSNRPFSYNLYFTSIEMRMNVWMNVFACIHAFICCKCACVLYIVRNACMQAFDEEIGNALQ